MSVASVAGWCDPSACGRMKSAEEANPFSKLSSILKSWILINVNVNVVSCPTII